MFANMDTHRSCADSHTRTHRSVTVIIDLPHLSYCTYQLGDKCTQTWSYLLTLILPVGFTCVFVNMIISVNMMPDWLAESPYCYKEWVHQHFYTFLMIVLINWVLFYLRTFLKYFFYIPIPMSEYYELKVNRPWKGVLALLCSYDIIFGPKMTIIMSVPRHSWDNILPNMTGLCILA